MFERLFDQGVPGPQPPADEGNAGNAAPASPDLAVTSAAPRDEQPTEENPYPAHLYDQGHDGPD